MNWHLAESVRGEREWRGEGGGGMHNTEWRVCGTRTESKLDVVAVNVCAEIAHPRGERDEVALLLALGRAFLIHPATAKG